MKLPKAFVPDKKYDLDKILEDPELTPKTIKKLLKNCEIYIKEKEKDSRFNSLYKLSEELASEITYNKKDIEYLSQKITIEKNIILGFHFSALVNKIIKANDTITLKFNNPLMGLGFNLDKGKLTIIGDVENWTGYWMKGGEMCIQGSTKGWIGYNMKGGKIAIAEDMLGKWIGYEMKGGEIHVDGEIGDIYSACKGKIYQRGKLIWPK